MAVDPGMDFVWGHKAAPYPNPMHDVISGFVPRRLKDLFKWVEYLYYNSAHIFAALKKFAEYPVTTPTIESSDESLKKNWDRVLMQRLKIKSVSIATGLDLQLYGNSFISIYSPINRFLKCSECKARAGIKKVHYKFKLKTLTFQYVCPSCRKTTHGKLHDEKSADETRLSVIRWDPKQIDINHNPITNESEYYYNIPVEFRQKVESGDAHLLSTIPAEFLEAIRDDKVFKFAENQIYHMKIPAPAGINSHWGFPPLTTTIKLFYYTSILRRANEAIAFEHIVPFRVLHPAPVSGNVEPAMAMNLQRFQNELKENIRRWRQDPNHVMFAPVALGVTMMGGQGRSLLTLGEIKEAEDEIIAAMGIPREFLYGGLSFTGSSITLRMLENQLETYTGALNEQLNWIIGQSARILGWQPAEAKFMPFKLIDDTAQKQTLLALAQSTQQISNTTLYDMHDININDERRKREQEALDEVRFQMDLDHKIKKLQMSIATQAQQEANAGVGLSYNPQAVLAQAEQLVDQLAGTDPGTQRSLLAQLSQEDPVMYAVVKDRWQTRQSMERQQAVTIARQNGQA